MFGFTATCPSLWQEMGRRAIFISLRECDDILSKTSIIMPVTPSWTEHSQSHKILTKKKKNKTKKPKKNNKKTPREPMCDGGKPTVKA